MPTYEYACKDCGQRMEIVQSFTDDSLTVCPACSGRLSKVFSPVGIVFKGGGFYKNDSRTGGDPATKAGAAAPGGSTTEASPSKADTKADAKAASSSSSSSSTSAASTSSSSSTTSAD